MSKHTISHVHLKAIPTYGIDTTLAARDWKEFVPVMKWLNAASMNGPMGKEVGGGNARPALQGIGIVKIQDEWALVATTGRTLHYIQGPMIDAFVESYRHEVPENKEIKVPSFRILKLNTKVMEISPSELKYPDPTDPIDIPKRGGKNIGTVRPNRSESTYIHNILTIASNTYNYKYLENTMYVHKGLGGSEVLHHLREVPNGALEITTPRPQCKLTAIVMPLRFENSVGGQNPYENQKYMVTVRHDGGEARIQTNARDMQTAIHYVMQGENCPYRSILKAELVLKDDDKPHRITE